MLRKANSETKTKKLPMLLKREDELTERNSFSFPGFIDEGKIKYKTGILSTNHWTAHPNKTIRKRNNINPL